jgi:hypothetical protein
MTSETAVHIGKCVTVARPAELKSRLEKPHTIIIGGASRGGTSAIAYAIARGGIDLGHDMPPNIEDQAIVDCIAPGHIDEEKLRGIFAKRSGRTWGFKVPAAAMHLPWLAANADNPIFVLVLRSPLAVAKSAINRDPTTFPSDVAGLNTALLHPMRYLQRIAGTIPTLDAPAVLVDYETAHFQSEAFVRDLFDTLAIQSSQEAAIAAELTADDYKPLASFTGYIDAIDGVVRGWARQVGREDPVSVQLVLGDKVLATSIANLPRADLKGNFAFSFPFPAGVDASELQVRIEGTYVLLPPSSKSCKENLSA